MAGLCICLQKGFFTFSDFLTSITVPSRAVTLMVDGASNGAAAATRSWIFIRAAVPWSMVHLFAWPGSKSMGDMGR